MIHIKFKKDRNNRCITVLLFSLWILYAGCGGTSGLRKEREKAPHILLISLDACRADHLSAYGYHRQTSPFMDKIAADGIRFENAFVNTHGTTPSHTTLFTSLYQETHKVEYHHMEKQQFNFMVPTQAVMLQEVLKVNGYMTLGVTGGGQLDHRYGFDRGFIVYDDQGGGIRTGCDKLLHLIEQYLGFEKPIFAFLHTYEIHSPYQPPPKYQTLFGDYPSDFIPTNENLLAICNSAGRDLSPLDLAHIQALYDGGIRHTDDVLKKTFRRLRDLGFLDDCLIIILADHGEEFGEHGGLLHRGFLYDELLRVPLIMAGKGLPREEIREDMVSLLDLCPTILSYAGIDARTPFMGKDILNPANLNERIEDEAVFAQYGNIRYTVRTRDWKFIKDMRPHHLKLFDLRNDPIETENLAESKPDLVSNFQQRLQDWKDKQPDLGIHQIQRLKIPQDLKEP